MARGLRDRLKFDLVRNRQELIQAVSLITDLNFAPSAGMKNYRSQLVEIGAMEAESIGLLRTGWVPEWTECEGRVTGTELTEILESLEVLRSDLIDVLDSMDDGDFQQPLDVPEAWAPFLGDTSLEREELFRWLARHEYYHLGQIIAYRWIEGFNPYRRSDLKKEQ